MEPKENMNIDLWLLVFIGMCLVSFLGAVLWPSAPDGASDKIKDVMQWLGLALGIGGAGALLKK